MCVVSYSSFVCISAAAYVNVYYESAFEPGYLRVLQVLHLHLCASAVFGTPAVWIPKKKNVCTVAQCSCGLCMTLKVLSKNSSRVSGKASRGLETTSFQTMSFSNSISLDHRTVYQDTTR